MGAFVSEAEVGEMPELEQVACLLMENPSGADACKLAREFIEDGRGDDFLGHCGRALGWKCGRHMP